MKESELAYIAGLFDGEGCITLCQHRTNNSLKFQPTALIMVCDKDVIDWLYKTIGFGYKSERAKLTKGWRKVYSYGVCNRADTLELLELLMPYLKIKKYPAQLVLEWCKNHKRAPSGNNPLCKTYRVPEWEIILFNKLKQHINPSFGM